MKNKATFYVFRHGETFASKNNVDYGKHQFTAEILPEGVPAVKRLGEYLKTVETDEQYTSEILRCVQTANIVTDITGKSFEKHSGLKEFLEASFVQFRDRVKRLISEFQKTPGTYLLCTHGAVVSALKHLLITGKYEEENLMDYPKTGVLLIIKNGTIKTLDFN